MRWEYVAPDHREVRPPGESGYRPRLHGVRRRWWPTTRRARSPAGTIRIRWCSPTSSGFQPRIGTRLAADLRFVAGGPRRLRRLLQHVGLQDHRDADGAAVAALEEPERAEQRRNPLTLANGFNASPGTTPNTFAVDPNFRVGYAQNWQVSVQRDLPGSLVMTATYLGIKGTRAQQEFLPNTYPAGAVNPCPACPSGFTYLTSNGNSTREAGQFQLRRRLHNGFTATLQYTYSKSHRRRRLGGRGQGNSA